MHRLKKCSLAVCPRCQKFEDTPHVWQCREADADAIWMKSLAPSEEWMTSVQTGSDVQDAIISQLSKWRSGSADNHMVPFQLQSPLDQQNNIGWHIFLGCSLNGNWFNRLTMI